MRNAMGEATMLSINGKPNKRLADARDAYCDRRFREEPDGVNSSMPGRKRTATDRFLPLMVLLLLVQWPTPSLSAERTPVAIESVLVSPEAVMPGKRPDIIANIRMRTNDPSIASRPISIIAVLTSPDHRTRSWIWKNIVLAAGASKSIFLPKEYDTKLSGEYRVEFSVYSGDVRRRFTASAKKFTVSEKPRVVGKSEASARKEREAETEARKPAPQKRAEYVVGLGPYANALNPAGGATILVWPGKYVGVQASYTVGTFTSYEARLLGRIVTASGWNPYVGVGYINVSKKVDVIGVSTTFSDSTVSGALGVEIPLGKRVFGYVEVTGAGIDLKKIVTNTGLTAEATIEYSPVSICAGLVFPLF